MNKRMAAAVLAALLAVLSAVSTAQSKQYDFTPLDVDLPGAWGTACLCVNSRGEVGGNYCDPAGFVHGFVWRSGVFTDVSVPGALGGYVAEVNGINDRGVGVGDYGPVVGKVAGFTVGPDGALTWPFLTTPDAIVTQPLGINNAGDIVGDYLLVPGGGFGDYGAFILRKGVYSTFTDPFGRGMGFTSINDRGQIIGYWGPLLFFWGPQETFVLDKGVFTTVRVPGAVTTDAFAINNRGQIAGGYVDKDGRAHGFVMDSKGKVTTVDYPGADQTFVQGINDNGEIVGSYNWWSFGFIARPRP